MTTNRATMDVFVANLREWARHHIAPNASVSDVRAMPGNAGVSFGFTVTPPDPGERFVVRLAPPGVRRRGNTDVLRQVPLLAALTTAGIPVAPVVWSSDDPQWFGTDALVQRFVPA